MIGKMENKNTPLALGGLKLLGFFLSRKKKGKCPVCRYLVNEDNKLCPSCNIRLDWSNFK